MIVSGPVTRTSISDSSSMRPPSIITAQSSWTSSTRAHVHSQDLAGGCGRGAQPQAREAAAQRAGAVRRGQHLCHRRRAGHHGLCLRVRYGRTTESSCYRLLNFPFVGVHPAGAHLLRPGGGGGRRADRRGECGGGGVSPELNMEIL